MGDRHGDEPDRGLTRELPIQVDRPGGAGKPINRRRSLLLLAGFGASAGAGAVIGRVTAPQGESNPLADATVGQPGPTRTALPTESGGPSTSAASASAPERPKPALPDRAVSMWINSFERPTVPELPVDVMETVNLVIFAMARSATAGTGTLRWEPAYQSYDDIAADITGLVSSGKPVLLGIGGASDGGITLLDDQNVEEFCDSIRFFVKTFGFTGIDIDLEPSGSSWNEESLVAAVRTLSAEFGNDFLVGLTVGLYGEYTASWLSLARALG